MRPSLHALALALALVPLAGCEVAPFDVTITNAGEEATWLSAGESTGILIGFDEQRNGEWMPLMRSLAFACMAECGAPGPVACASAAAELSVAYALLPGDSATKSFDSDWWAIDEAAGCAIRTAMTGPVRANLCHSPEAEDEIGDLLDTPAQSGVPDGAGGATLVTPTCESFELDLSSGVGTVTLGG